MPSQQRPLEEVSRAASLSSILGDGAHFRPSMVSFAQPLHLLNDLVPPTGSAGGFLGTRRDLLHLVVEERPEDEALLNPRDLRVNNYE
jgi:hypothetical protein